MVSYTGCSQQYLLAPRPAGGHVDVLPEPTPPNQKCQAGGTGLVLGRSREWKSRSSRPLKGRLPPETRVQVAPSPLLTSPPPGPPARTPPRPCAAGLEDRAISSVSWVKACQPCRPSRSPRWRAGPDSGCRAPIRLFPVLMCRQHPAPGPTRGGAELSRLLSAAEKGGRFPAELVKHADGREAEAAGGGAVSSPRGGADCGWAEISSVGRGPSFPVVTLLERVCSLSTPSPPPVPAALPGNISQVLPQASWARRAAEDCELVPDLTFQTIPSPQSSSPRLGEREPFASCSALRYGTFARDSSPGTKGLECSPSTPTMNSYFYKFMINLLKRFSSERKLLEVRGGFIIRAGFLSVGPVGVWGRTILCGSGCPARVGCEAASPASTRWMPVAPSPTQLGQSKTSPDDAKGPLGGTIIPADSHGYRATEMDSYRHLPKEEGFFRIKLDGWGLKRPPTRKTTDSSHTSDVQPAVPPEAAPAPVISSYSFLWATPALWGGYLLSQRATPPSLGSQGEHSPASDVEEPLKTCSFLLPVARRAEALQQRFTGGPALGWSVGRGNQTRERVKELNLLCRELAPERQACCTDTQGAHQRPGPGTAKTTRPQVGVRPHWKEAMFSRGASLLPRVTDPQKIPTKTRPDVLSSSSSSPRALILLPVTSQKSRFPKREVLHLFLRFHRPHRLPGLRSRSRAAVPALTRDQFPEHGAIEPPCFAPPESCCFSLIMALVSPLHPQPCHR
ncbi:hypothetical protein J1605_006743 [Eschrichtius robustus]|uniref:Uncharacterized protein n=1 Tax=Eschrichtius robustus TaxID=9764 RepID=A0AB34H201_ESCRO|nr:hypothetical protein J1605_006743 [Eschrichtius robustus]